MQNLALWLDRQISAVASAFGFLYATATGCLDFRTSLEKGTKNTLTFLNLAYIALVGVVDLKLGRGMEFGFFYSIGCAFAGWVLGKRAAFLSALFAGVFSCLDESLAGPAPFPPYSASVFWWNAAASLLAFLMIGWVAAEGGRLTRGLERTVQQRTASLQSEADEHKQTAVRLREALQLFRQVTENITEVFWVTDPAKTRVSYVSPEFEKVWGRPRKAVYMSPSVWLEAVHEEDRERVAEATYTQIKGTYDEEFRVVRPDHSVRWVHERAFPVKNENGELYRIVGITEDITDRRRADEMLRTQARILESMAEGVVMSDEQGIIRLTNPAADLILGYEHGELLGQSVAVLSSPATGVQPDELRAAMETVKTRGTIAGEYLLRRKDGTERWIETRSSGLNLGGKFYIVTVGQDITDRLRLERQILEISDREQARIGQDIHDGLCQKLISLAFDVNSLGQSLAERQASSAAAARTIADLLDETITESRRVARGLYPVRLEAEGLVSALKELANTTTERFGIGCSCTASASEVPCDTTAATHLFRIAQEAVNNAVKHSSCGNIAIQLTDAKAEIHLAITDDGKGMDSVAIAENSGRPSGMGMYIMDYRARSLGGSLRVTPGGQGGITVLCRVPQEN